MYELIHGNKVVDISTTEPITSTEGILMNNCMYSFSVGAWTVINVPNLEVGMELVGGVWTMPKDLLPQPTNQEIADNQITLMDVLATIYEGMILKGTV